MSLTDVENRAKAIVVDLQWIADTQCVNCGKVYRNVDGTHDRRFFGLVVSRCEYEPRRQGVDTE